MALAYKCTVFNIGAEGQLLVGAIAAGNCGNPVSDAGDLKYSLRSDRIHAGRHGLGFFPALLKQKANVNVVIQYHYVQPM